MSNRYVYFLFKLKVFIFEIETGFVTGVTRRVIHGEQELPTLPEHLSSTRFINGNRFAQSSVVCVLYVDDFCHVVLLRYTAFDFLLVSINFALPECFDIWI